MDTTTATITLWPEARHMRGFYERFRGLNGEPEPSHRQAFWFPRCRAVHTLGMQAPIDILGLDRTHRVVAIRRHVLPGRSVYFKGCYGVIELAAFCPWPLEQWIGQRLLFIQHGEPVDVLKEANFSIAIAATVS